MKQIFALIALGMLSQPLLGDTRIAVVGATQDMQLIERWAAAEGATVKDAKRVQSFKVGSLKTSVLAPKPGSQNSLVASMLYQADAAVIVIDATQGPLPSNREHIILARQAGVPYIVIMMANVDQLDVFASDEARDLLKLQVEEVRAVMEAYELDGRSALVFHDAGKPAYAPRPAAGGLEKIASLVSRLSTARSRSERFSSQHRAVGQVYLLTDAETNGRSVSVAKATTMTLWSEGSTAPVEVTAQPAAGPGDVAEVSIQASDVFLGAAGSRIVLLRNDRVVGIGLLTEVGNHN